ncbi:MAG: hypothetical protein PQ612_08460 [Rickettsiales bacterium]|nr:hypothetical protein [Pseudomonadota bacterium]MDA0966746.1 hypothetical protein [Pseudomonadota bacterium]MDG4543418.1 hypothetical protein [Rickettsiales bacterium]MDG4546188.1 hypothetical protein [Rickettsiales bacterium]MDG4547661.1 hypothetical protein [Rickettsiales bacterium]
MVASITPPPIHNKVEKTYVSSKDPHHEINKDKKDKDRHSKNNEPEDIVDISSEDEGSEDNKKFAQKNRYPDNPMQGHIDIDV